MKNKISDDKKKFTVNGADFCDVFGSLKFKKSAQELKNLAREGWD